MQYGSQERAAARDVETAQDEAGLVGTPYFWTGIAGSLALWAAFMLAISF